MTKDRFQIEIDSAPRMVAQNACLIGEIINPNGRWSMS